jgi:gliding motility-associated-like protein
VLTVATTYTLNTNDDAGLPVNGAIGGTVVENVLANDFFETNPVEASIVDITVVSTSSQQVSLDLTNGRVVVASNTPAGLYQLKYRICLKDYPNVCSEATVSISVIAPEIIANNDTGTPVYDTKGGVVVENVTANDLLNGEPVDIVNVTITLITPPAISGIDLNSETGEVKVKPGLQPDTYSMTYRICEVLNPANCDEATISVTIMSADECEFLIPTGFSPNDDGIHDFFMIKCIEKYPDATLEVFNRWGNLVYKKEKYGNIDQWGEADAWWGGYSNRSLNLGKEKLPPGTYFYILKLNNIENESFKGSVFLNR